MSHLTTIIHDLSVDGIDTMTMLTCELITIQQIMKEISNISKEMEEYHIGFMESLQTNNKTLEYFEDISITLNNMEKILLEKINIFKISYERFIERFDSSKFEIMANLSQTQCDIRDLIEVDIVNLEKIEFAMRNVKAQTSKHTNMGKSQVKGTFKGTFKGVELKRTTKIAIETVSTIQKHQETTKTEMKDKIAPSSLSNSSFQTTPVEHDHLTIKFSWLRYTNVPLKNSSYCAICLEHNPKSNWCKAKPRYLTMKNCSIHHHSSYHIKFNKQS